MKGCFLQHQYIPLWNCFPCYGVKKRNPWRGGWQVRQWALFRSKSVMQVCPAVLPAALAHTPVKLCFGNVPWPSLRSQHCYSAGAEDTVAVWFLPPPRKSYEKQKDPFKTKERKDFLLEVTVTFLPFPPFPVFLLVLFSSSNTMGLASAWDMLSHVHSVGKFWQYHWCMSKWTLG